MRSRFVYIIALFLLYSCETIATQPQLELPAGSGRTVLYMENVSLSVSYSCQKWFDFNSGKGWTQQEFSALSNEQQQLVDMGIENGKLCNHKGKTYKTRFHVMNLKAEEFAALKYRDDLFSAVDDIEWNKAPMQMELPSDFPKYIAFKTFTPEEENCYGIMELVEASDEAVRFNCKFCDISSDPAYSVPRHVTVSKGRMYVDGKEFYVNGAAATMAHSLMADYGANVCRIYSSSMQTRALLDELHESGLMCYVGLPAPSYSSFSAEDPTYDDPAYRESRINTVIKIVEALKDHPAVLCWSLGNEVEGGGNDAREGTYKYYGELAAAIRKIDPDHPVTAAFTETPTAFKISKVNEYCPDLDFLSFNSYYSVLKTYQAGSSKSYTQMLEEFGWSKPYMITEFGPTGTWKRSDPELKKRINDWGALIQLTSDEAAAKYIECWKLIRNYSRCLGGFAFWWGYQTHGQVLGWYPFFTKDMIPLTPVEAMESCWKGVSYSPQSPSFGSWTSAIELNGMTLADASASATGRSEKNPVLKPGQSCTAKANAEGRNGSNSALVYKWFIYKDCTYSHKSGDKDWTKVTWTDCESVYSMYGQHKSMDEDAGAELFEDRTRQEVVFRAPSEDGNYRLYVIVIDKRSGKASSACLNFQVKN